MLDIHAHRLDVAEVVRVARNGHGSVLWCGRWEITFDDECAMLTFDDGLEIDLEWVRVRVPSTGRLVAGPVLARCPRGCGSRARVLWSPRWFDDVFPVCRTCAGIEYASVQADELERAKLAYARIRRQLGLSKHMGHERRPYQRRRAYERDHARLAKAKARVDAARNEAIARIERARSDMTVEPQR